VLRDPTATIGGLWRFCGMPYRPSERSVSDERARLQVLGASLRAASFKTLIARYKRRLPPMIIERPSPPDGPRELPTMVPPAITEAD
jgi:hypothetical protein